MLQLIEHIIRISSKRDRTEINAALVDAMQDLFSLQKNGNTTFKVYYSSTELPKGRQLAAVVLGNSNKVQP